MSITAFRKFSCEHGSPKGDRTAFDVSEVAMSQVPIAPPTKCQGEWRNPIVAAVWGDMDHSPSDGVSQAPHQAVEDVVWCGSTVKVYHNGLNYPRVSKRGPATLPPCTDSE